jgi:hypothetical protein
VHQDAFEAELRSAGYTKIQTKSLDPKPTNTQHVHDCDIRGRGLDGIVIVVLDDRPVTYRLEKSLACPRENGTRKKSVRMGHRFSSAANTSTVPASDGSGEMPMKRQDAPSAVEVG